LNWTEAGFGPAPSLEQARANLEQLQLASKVQLHKERAEQFLSDTDITFDFIYIDTSHDYETTRTTIDLSIPRLNPNGVIGGDDFSDEGTWGVARAVKDSFTKFDIQSDWLWLAEPKNYQGCRHYR
jgi:predicted O-methyltransferase YrrM